MAPSNIPCTPPPDSGTCDKLEVLRSLPKTTYHLFCWDEHIVRGLTAVAMGMKDSIPTPNTARFPQA